MLRLVRDHLDQFADQVRVRCDQGRLIHAGPRNHIVGVAICVDNLAVHEFEGFSQLGEEVFDLFLAESRQRIGAARSQISVERVRLLRDRVHTANDVLLPITKQLDQLLNALVVFEPDPHPADLVGRAIHQEPLRITSNANGRRAKSLDRHVANDTRQALVHHIDVDGRILACLQADVGVGAIPPLNVIERRRVVLPIVPTPCALIILAAGGFARLVGCDLGHWRQGRIGRNDRDEVFEASLVQLFECRHVLPSKLA